MKNHDFNEIKFEVSDLIESYFECTLRCDIKYGSCISKYVEILKQYEN